MRKIMFSDRFGLTKAVLEGRKTMTRRFISEDVLQRADVYRHKHYEDTHGLLPGKEALIEFSTFKVGEVVAVAQNYNEVFDEFADIVYLQGKPVPDNLKAFGGQSDVTLPKTLPGWNNKMFVKADLMPHRIRITNVRVERLQDISDEDCLKEGFTKEAVNNGWGNYAYHYEAMLVYYDRLGRSKETRSRNPREAYAALIDRVCGKGTWDKNPWVFVYEFELVK